MPVCLFRDNLLNSLRVLHDIHVNADLLRPENNVQVSEGIIKRLNKLQSLQSELKKSIFAQSNEISMILQRYEQMVCDCYQLKVSLYLWCDGIYR